MEGWRKMEQTAGIKSSQGRDGMQGNRRGRENEQCKNE